MIKLKNILSENSLKNTHKEGYFIQKNWEGYGEESWCDDLGGEDGYEDLQAALKVFKGYKGALKASNKEKLLIRLVKRTTIVKDEIIKL